ncbi:hypothetical protein LguiA_012862 [Lonicera macranthoides]
MSTAAAAATQISPSQSQSQSTDLIDFVVKKGNGVTGLSQLNLKSLPHQYIQPIEERFDPTQLQTNQEEPVPVIDVSNWADPNVSESICDAASKWGFFQIVGHEVPEEVMEGVKGAAHRFFRLPVEERRKYLKGNLVNGTVELKTSFSPEKEKVLEWRDILSHFYKGEEDGESQKYWPSVSKDQVLEYIKWTKPLIKKLIEVLMKGLNVKDPIEEAKESLLMGSLVVNLIYYPKCPSPELTAGTGRHSDVSTISVLLQDDVGGLYVRGGTGSDCWIHVTPVKGTLVINIGDVLQIISNDRYKSVEHRVLVSADKTRVSVPIFVNPGLGAVVGPLAEVLEKGEQALYKQLLYSDYYNYFFSKGHDGKQTIEFAKI